MGRLKMKPQRISHFKRWEKEEVPKEVTAREAGTETIQLIRKTRGR